MGVPSTVCIGVPSRGQVQISPPILRNLRKITTGTPLYRLYRAMNPTVLATAVVCAPSFSETSIEDLFSSKAKKNTWSLVLFNSSVRCFVLSPKTENNNQLLVTIFFVRRSKPEAGKKLTPGMIYNNIIVRFAPFKGL